MKYLYVFLFYPFLLFGQGQFVSNHKSAIGANVGYVANSNLSGVGGSAGLSIKGLVDFGVEYVSSTYTQSNFPDVNVNSTAFYIAYNLKRENKITDLRILAGYLTSNSSGTFSATAKAQGILFGINFTASVYHNDSFTLMPGMSLTYGFVSVSGGSSYYSSNSYVDNSRSLSFEFNVVPKLSNIMRMFITPAVSKDLNKTNDSLTFGINAGLVVDFAN